jgi:hypothetical protein
MGERKSFDIGNQPGEIVLHPGGELTIESEGDYGDSEIGWGTVTTTINLSPEKVAELRKFLGSS